MNSLLNEKFRRSPEVVSRVVDSEMVLLNLRSGQYFGLNESGAVVWETLGDEGATGADLVNAILTRFAVNVEEARRDLEGLLASLVGAGLIVLHAE